MSPMQQIFLGLGAKKKVYLDDVFNNYLWRGNSIDNRAINVGFDYASEEGLVWIKNRQDSDPHCLFDTLRGANKRLACNTTSTETTTSVELKSFTSTGYTLGTDGTVNGNTKPFVSWNFKSAPGFFDVVQFTTSNSANQRIPHSLGSIPGMIIIKNLHSADNWLVYHRETGRSKWTDLSNSDATATSANIWGTGNPTSTDFGFNSAGWLGNNSYNFIAYVFAGGESAASGAQSVDFGGSAGDQLSIASTSDFAFGTGDFTIEFWLKWETGGNTYPYILDMRDSGSDFGTTNRVLLLIRNPSQDFKFMLNGSFVLESTDKIPRDTWNHFAVVRHSGTTSLYVNGASNDSFSDSTNYGNAPAVIGQKQGNDNPFSGKISNLRIVKGTAVYTTSFRPTYEPLTNITNTKLLCCNSSTATGSTVTPGTISSSGSVFQKSGSPFDDPAGLVFGDSGTENLIKLGSYQGNGSSDGPKINLGWEPQWVLVRRTDSGNNWELLDNMRGWTTDAGETDARLNPDLNYNEYQLQRSYLTPTGFGIETTSSSWNADGGNYIYMAIRRPDGYVGKPIELGTDVFAASLPTNNAPWFKNGNFPVDISIHKRYDQSEDWYQASRLQGPRGLRPSTTAAEATISTDYWKWDYMEGWNSYGSGTNAGNYISYQFKRHAGFDVVTWKNNTNSNFKAINHSLAKKPEMIWLKDRDHSGGNAFYGGWKVFHSGLSVGGGLNSQFIYLNTNGAQTNSGNIWGESTSDLNATSFSYYTGSCDNGSNLIAMLFASVDGVSKVGSYSGSNSSQTITTGFQPRFCFIKRTDIAQGWVVLDTVRGWTSGNDERLEFHNNSAQNNNTDFGAPTSTGFTLTSTAKTNVSGGSFIYYAHA